MKLTVSRSAAIAAALSATVARTVLALAVDGGPVHCGVWIAALLGMLPAIPYLACLDRIRAGMTSNRPVHLALMAFLMLVCASDATIVLSAIVRSSAFLSPDQFTVLGLILPVGLAALWCVWRNGDAIGYGAMLWTRLFPLLLLVVILLQARRYRPEWLFPLLGKGWKSIFGGAVQTAGLFVPAAAMLVVGDASGEGDEGRKARYPAWLLAGSGLVSALLLVLRLMMAPTLLQDQQWLQRLDALLTNGRAPLYLQLPMIVLWFIGLLHLLACECFASSALLQRLVPTLDGRICATTIVLICCLASAGGFPTAAQKKFAGEWLFIIASLLVGLDALLPSIPNRGRSPC